MDAPGWRTVRRFSRVVTQRLGALNDEYLAPAPTARGIPGSYEIGEAGAERAPSAAGSASTRIPRPAAAQAQEAPGRRRP